MEEPNTKGIYTTVGERENRPYESLELSNIGIYNEAVEVSAKESRASKVLREDYVNKWTFIGVVTVLMLLLLITLTVLIYVKATSKQEVIKYLNCPEKLNDKVCGHVMNETNGQARVINSSQPSSNIITCNYGYGPTKSKIKCQDNGEWETVTCEKVIDCRSILEDFPSAEDGVYEIPLLDYNKWTPVYCDMTLDGGGWTVIQNRFDGSVDFYRNFSDYENGFGNTSGEFWLGLKNIQNLANKGPTEIRLQMTSNNSEEGFEVFQDFKLVDGDDYRLNINITSGILSPEIFPNTSFAYNNGMAFSTYDKDMDRWPNASISQYRHGAWWYHFCSFANLNGRYCEPGTFCKNRKSGHNHRFGKEESLLKSRMLLRCVRK